VALLIIVIFVIVEKVRDNQFVLVNMIVHLKLTILKVELSLHWVVLFVETMQPISDRLYLLISIVFPIYRISISILIVYRRLESVGA